MCLQQEGRSHAAKIDNILWDFNHLEILAWNQQKYFLEGKLYKCHDIDKPQLVAVITLMCVVFFSAKNKESKIM